MWWGSNSGRDGWCGGTPPEVVDLERSGGETGGGGSPEFGAEGRRFFVTMRGLTKYIRVIPPESLA